VPSDQTQNSLFPTEQSGDRETLHQNIPFVLKHFRRTVNHPSISWPPLFLITHESESHHRFSFSQDLNKLHPVHPDVIPSTIFYHPRIDNQLLFSSRLLLFDNSLSLFRCTHYNTLCVTHRLSTRIATINEIHDEYDEPNYTSNSNLHFRQRNISC